MMPNRLGETLSKARAQSSAVLIALLAAINCASAQFDDGFDDFDDFGSSSEDTASRQADEPEDTRSAISHTWIEVSTFDYDVQTDGALDVVGAQDRSTDGDGFTVDASVHIPPFGEVQHFAVVARYSSGSSDADIDFSTLRAGLKYFFMPKDAPARFSFAGELKYEEKEYGEGGDDNTLDGYSIMGNWRFYADERVEVKLAGGWVDLGDPQGFRVAIGAAVELPWQIFAVVDWENEYLTQDFDTRTSDQVDDRYTVLRLGLRKAFDF